jgi:polyhydroxyalkanoate synthesis regulator phasin
VSNQPLTFTDKIKNGKYVLKEARQQKIQGIIDRFDQQQERLRQEELEKQALLEKNKPARTADDYYQKSNTPIGKTMQAFDTFKNRATSGWTLGVQDVVESKLFPEQYKATKKQAEDYPISATLGTIAGYINPGAAATKLASKIPFLSKIGAKVASKTGKQALGKVAQIGVQEGIAGLVEAPISASRAISEGKDLKDIAIDTAKGTGYGVLAGGVGGALFSGVGSGISSLKNQKQTTKALQNIDANYKQIADDFAGFRSTTKPDKSTLVSKQPMRQIQKAQLKPKELNLLDVNLGDKKNAAKINPAVTEGTLNTAKPKSNIDSPSPSKTALKQQIKANSTTPELIPQKNRYTPEIQNKINEIDSNIKTYKDSQKNLFERNLIDQQEYNKRIKADAMKQSAIKREIIQGDSLIDIEGGLTPKELSNKIKRLKGNYIGKEIVTPDGEGVVIGNNFGKVKVKMADGSERIFDNSKINPKVDIDELIAQQKRKAPTYKKTETAKPEVKAEPTKPTKEVSSEELKDYTDLETKSKPKSVEKEPWEISKKEYIDMYLWNHMVTNQTARQTNEKRKFIINAHKNYIRKSLKEGKPVPAEVLKDYPELAKLKKQTPTAKVSNTPKLETPQQPKDVISEKFGKPANKVEADFYSKKNNEIAKLVDDVDSGKISLEEGRKISDDIQTDIQRFKEARFTSSNVQKSDVVTDNVKQKFRNNPVMYETISNVDTLEKANTRIDKDGFDKALGYFDASPEINADNVALGEALFVRSIQKGDYNTADKIGSTLALKGVKAGQAVQAFSMLGKMTPEGTLKTAQDIVREVNKQLSKRVGYKATSLSNVDSKKIVDAMKEVQKAQNGKLKLFGIDLQKFAETKIKEINDIIRSAGLNKKMIDRDNLKPLVEAFKKINQNSTDSEAIKQAKQIFKSIGFDMKSFNDADVRSISKSIFQVADAQTGKLKLDGVDLRRFTEDSIEVVRQILGKNLPVATMEKIDSLRRISMLFNPRTHIRNVVNNTLFIPVRQTSDVIGAGMEKIFLKEGQRTKYAGKISDNVKRLVDADWEANKRMLSKGGRYDLDAKTLSLEKEVFKKGSVTKGIEKITGNKMEKGILQMLNELSYSTLNIEDVPYIRSAYKDSLSGYLMANKMSTVTNTAREYAQRRAFEATYKQANFLSDMINKAKRKGGAIGYVTDIFIPFSKTPANIAARGWEYSPGGLIGAMFGKNNKTPAMIIEEISKGLTGTALFGAGIGLSALGWSNIKNDSSPKLRAIKERTGVAGFTIKTPKGGYTFEWGQPVTIPMAMGMRAWEVISKGKSEEEQFKLSKILMDTIIESGDTFFDTTIFNSIKRSFQDNRGSTSKALVGLPASFIEQLIPTFVGQIARTVDPVQRNAYTGDTFQQMVDRIKAKTPFLSKTLPARVDVFGEEKTYGDTIPSRIASQFLSPGRFFPDKGGKIENELIRLSEETKNTNILPKIPTKKISHRGKNIEITQQELSEYKKELGKATYQELDKFINSDSYERMSDNARVRRIQNIIDSTYNREKNKITREKQALQKVSK